MGFLDIFRGNKENKETKKNQLDLGNEITRIIEAGIGNSSLLKVKNHARDVGTYHITIEINSSNILLNVFINLRYRGKELQLVEGKRKPIIRSENAKEKFIDDVKRAVDNLVRTSVSTG